MRMVHRALRIVTLAVSLALAANGCSEASGTGPDDSGLPATPSNDGGASGEDGGSNDASADSDVGAPKRTCSSEAWCHTVVPDGQTLRDVWGDGKGAVWTVSEQGNILRWDGTAWVTSYSAGVPLYAIWGSSETDLWAGGGARTTGNIVLPGVLLHGTGKDASSITWKEVPAPLAIRSIWGTSATDVWAVASLTHRLAVGDTGYVLHYSGPAAEPDGSEWKTDPVTSAFPMVFQKVWGTSRDDVWLSGRIASSSFAAQARVLHRRPDGSGGFTWRLEQPTPRNQGINWELGPAYVFGASLSPTHVILVRFNRNDGFVYDTGISTDEGATFQWTQNETSATGYRVRALSTVWGTGPNDIWMAGSVGRLRHWDGATWRVALVSVDEELPVVNAMHAIWGSGPGDIWVVGADVALHKVMP